jgi:hypothetical protein
MADGASRRKRRARTGARPPKELGVKASDRSSGDSTDRVMTAERGESRVGCRRPLAAGRRWTLARTGPRTRIRIRPTARPGRSAPGPTRAAMEWSNPASRRATASTSAGGSRGGASRWQAKRHVLTERGFYLTRLFEGDPMKNVWPERGVGYLVRRMMCGGGRSSQGSPSEDRVAAPCTIAAGRSGDASGAGAGTAVARDSGVSGAASSRAVARIS